MKVRGQAALEHPLLLLITWIADVAGHCDHEFCDDDTARLGVFQCDDDTARLGVFQ